MIIAVDGPAGAGKGTICNIVARKLGITNFCSGEVYRLCAYLMQNSWEKRKELGAEYLTPEFEADEEFVASLQPICELRIVHPNDLHQLIIDGVIHYTWNLDKQEAEIWVADKNVRENLHENHISILTSEISSIYAEQIAELVKIVGQRITSDFICEGRNIGSFTFPEAKYKFYVDAKAEIRAQRRLEDLAKRGTNMSFDTVLKEIIDRDYKDMNRSHSPLVKPVEAIVIDTSNQTIPESVEGMLSYLK